MTKRKIQAFREWHFHVIGLPGAEIQRMSSREKYELYKKNKQWEKLKLI
jgi:hypothetical protein